MNQAVPSPQDHRQPRPNPELVEAPGPTTTHRIDGTSVMPGGYRDAFYERRFNADGAIDIERLVRERKVAFLSKANHVDELYSLATSKNGLEAGMYRIREQGAERPLLTLKRHGDGVGQASETIDQVDPEDAVLATIREHGTLLAVIEKHRTTYHSKTHPQCLFHMDDVTGLGRYYDVKADRPEDLNSFVKELGLQNSATVNQSYLMMKQSQGISQIQLRAWLIQQRFSDYILGVVSGTLTPLGFLTATIASGAPKSAMVVALASAGLCDGLSDSVAAAQTTQSGVRGSFWDQLSMFGKTMLGKVAVPCTFVPIVLASGGALSTTLSSCVWAGALLSSTAAIQAVAHGRAVVPAVARILGFGGAAVIIGASIGEFLPPLLSRLLGAS